MSAPEQWEVEQYIQWLTDMANDPAYSLGRETLLESAETLKAQAQRIKELEGEKIRSYRHGYQDGWISKHGIPEATDSEGGGG